MRKIDSESGLKEAIYQLQTRQSAEAQGLKEQFFHTVDSIKPMNLIKNTIKAAVGSPDLKANVLSSTVGLASGILAKVIIGSVMKSPINKIVGTAVMFGITKVIARNPEVVRSVGKRFLHFLRGRS